MSALEDVDLLLYALQSHLGSLTVFSIAPLVMDTGRQRGERGPAWIKIAATDDAVKNIRGNEKLRDTFILIRIPREVDDRRKSPILLPGEVKIT